MLSRRAELWEWSARKVRTPRVQRSVLASIFFFLVTFLSTRAMESTKKVGLMVVSYKHKI